MADAVSFGEAVKGVLERYLRSGADGVCYVKMFRPECEMQGYLQSFSWPTLDVLMGLRRELCKDTSELEKLYLRSGVSSNLYHLVHVEEGLRAADVKLLDVLSTVDGEKYAEGTLGREFGQGGVSVVSKFIMIGGNVEEFPYSLYDDRLKPYLSAQVVERFFSAFAWHCELQCLSQRGVAVVQSEELKESGVLAEALDMGVPAEVSTVMLGPKGGVSVGRGKNYMRNRAARIRRQMKSGSEQEVALQRSLEAKWEAENKLAVKQAERRIALLDARDLEAEKRMQRAQIMRTTESAKVQTERAYATLKRTGNVPGFAETVVTDGSCPGLSPGRSDGTCISPDSSVSQQEIRAMMKENEDLKLTLKRIERDNPALVAHHMEGYGVKTAFTLDSDGLCPVDEPGSMGADGKYHLDSYEPNPRFYKDRFRAEEFAEKYFGS